MKYTLRTLARLLGYPSAELKAHIPDLRNALERDRALPKSARSRLGPLLDRLARHDVLDAPSAPSDDPALIDEEWEEREVTFTGAHDMGGPTGIVAKLRAAGKAMTAERRGNR